MLSFKNLKPKGLEKQKVKWQTKFDDRLRKGASRPSIELNTGDRFNQLVMWLQGFVIDIGAGIVKNIIPGYVWILLVVVLAIILIIVIV